MGLVVSSAVKDFQPRAAVRQHAGEVFFLLGAKVALGLFRNDPQQVDAVLGQGWHCLALTGGGIGDGAQLNEVWAPNR